MKVDRKRPAHPRESEPARHTPGPWHTRPSTAQSPSRAIVSALSGGVTIYDAPLTVETAANARLIAAAPDLLAVLEEIIGAGLVCPSPIGAPGSPARERWEAERALIDRARGLVAAVRLVPPPRSTSAPECVSGSVSGSVSAAEDVVDPRDAGPCDHCGGTGVLRVEREPDGSGGGAVPCRCRDFGPPAHQAAGVPADQTPLVMTGPGGDYRTERRPCANCRALFVPYASGGRTHCNRCLAALAETPGGMTPPAVAPTIGLAVPIKTCSLCAARYEATPGDRSSGCPACIESLRREAAPMGRGINVVG